MNKTLRFWIESIFWISDALFKVFIVVFILHYAAVTIQDTEGSISTLRIMAIMGIFYYFKNPYYKLMEFIDKKETTNIIKESRRK